MPKRHANTHDPAESMRKYKKALDNAETSMEATNAAIDRRDRWGATKGAQNLAYWLGHADTERTYATDERGIESLRKRHEKIERHATGLADRMDKLP